MTTASAERQFTGKHMLASIVAFFGVIIAVNLTMAYFANSTWSGLIVKNGFVASQSFGKDLAKAQAQESLGWTMDMHHDLSGVSVSFADRNSQPLRDLMVEGTLRRPATDKQDQRVTFAFDGSAYVAAAKLTPGVWELEVDAANGAGESYRKTYRFFVKG